MLVSEYRLCDRARVSRRHTPMMVLVGDRIASARSALSGGRATLVAMSAAAWAASRTSLCDRVGLLQFDVGVRQAAGDCESVEHNRRPYPPALSLAHVRPGDMPRGLICREGSSAATTARGHDGGRRAHEPHRTTCRTRGARGERLTPPLCSLGKRVCADGSPTPKPRHRVASFQGHHGTGKLDHVGQ